MEEIYEKRRNISTFAMKRDKTKELIRLLEDDGGFEIKRTAGDHRQFKHPVKKGRVTVRGKPNETVEQFLINSIFKQAGWK